ncbi:MAG: hypothetical protein EOS28_17390 [Mesorhizobium sp.]|nr:MAG: hypothetical protein EOS28_17390 [Mesorhizobium sp.]
MKKDALRAAFHNSAEPVLFGALGGFFLRRNLLLLRFFHIIAIAFSADRKTALEFRREIEL